MADTQPLLVIDLHAVLRRRLPPRVSRFVPRFLVSGLARVIRQKELNEILKATYPGIGSEFAEKVLQHLEIEVEVQGLHNLPEGGRFMFASNHPLGGLDGIALIAVLGRRFGDDNIRFLVNDMLLNVTPLEHLFLPVNKFGKQGREASVKISEAIASDKQIFQFPAGLCSRLGPGGEIADLEWQKSFVAKALESKRDIVPVFFEGKNSSVFYHTARWRKRLGLRFNVEQILLPSEICKARGSRFRIIFGKPLSWQSLKESGKSPKELAAEIRSLVYSLGSR